MERYPVHCHIIHRQFLRPVLVYSTKPDGGNSHTVLHRNNIANIVSDDSPIFINISHFSDFPVKKIRQDKSATITANENPIAPTVKSEPEEQNDIIVDGDIKEEANECEEDDCMPNGEKEVFSRTM